ncbi:hypothetical protein Tco_0375416 [Tanacetum coccineum]
MGVGRLGTHGKTRNIGLKKVTDEYGPLKIQFEFNDKGTLLHLGENSARWSNLVGKNVREYPMYYPSWHKIEEEEKAGVLGRLMQHFDLTPHIRSKLWPKIKKGIEQHMASRSKCSKPRGTYTDADVDELKEDSKRLRKELELLRRVVRSDDRMSQLLTQLESQPEVGGGNRSGGGEYDERGGDEDVGRDEEI